MANLKLVKDIPNCLYNKLDTSVANYTYEQTTEQLDFCLGCDKYSSCDKVAELKDRLVEIEHNENKKAETFHNDTNKVADMLLIGKDEFLKSYSYLSEDDYNITINQILYNLFSYSQRQEYVEFLINEGQEEYAKKILPEHFMSTK